MRRAEEAAHGRPLGWEEFSINPAPVGIESRPTGQVPLLPPASLLLLRWSPVRVIESHDTGSLRIQSPGTSTK